MKRPSWFRSISLVSRARHGRSRPQRSRFRPTVDPLEERCLLALTVTAFNRGPLGTPFTTFSDTETEISWDVQVSGANMVSDTFQPAVDWGDKSPLDTNPNHFDITESNNTFRYLAIHDYPGLGTFQVTFFLTDATTGDKVQDTETVKIVPRTLTWSGQGDGVSWNDVKNWDGSHVPGFLDNVVFPSNVTPAQPLNNNLSAGSSLTTIDFQGSQYDLQGNAVALSGGLSQEGNHNTIELPITLNGSDTFAVAPTTTLVVSGDLSGSGNLTVTNTGGSGAGILQLGSDRGLTEVSTLGGNLSLRTPLEVLGGESLVVAATLDVKLGPTNLQIDPQASVEVASTGTFMIDPLSSALDSGTLQLDGGDTATIDGTLTVNEMGQADIIGTLPIGAMVTLQDQAVVTLGAEDSSMKFYGLTGQGTIEVDSGTTLKSLLSNVPNDPFNGTINLKGGTIKTQGSGDFGTATLNLVSGLLQNVGSNSVALSDTVTLGGNVTISTAKGLALNGNLTVTAVSTVTVTQAGASNGLVLGSSRTTTLGGAAVVFTGTAVVVAQETLSAATTITAGTTLQLNGAGGAATITVLGGVLLGVGHNPFFQGPVTVNGGMASLDEFDGLGSGTLDLLNGQLISDSSNALTLNNPVDLEGNDTIETGGGLGVAGNVTVFGGSGARFVTVTEAATSSGLTITNSSSLAGAPVIFVAGDATDTVSLQGGISANVTATAGIVVNLGGGMANGQPAGASGAGSLTVLNSLVGIGHNPLFTGAVTVDGSTASLAQFDGLGLGTLNLNGANLQFTGSSSVTLLNNLTLAGNVAINTGPGFALNNNDTVTVTSPSTVTLSQAANSAGLVLPPMSVLTGAPVTFTGTGAVQLQGTISTGVTTGPQVVLSLGEFGASQDVSAQGAGALTIQGQLNLVDNADYAGSITLQDGSTLTTQDKGASYGTGLLTISGRVNMNLTAGALDVGDLTVASASTLTVNHAITASDEDVVVNGTLSGTALTVTGSGVLALKGTVSAAVTNGQGTGLELDGASGAGSITVQGTLNGVGQFHNPQFHGTVILDGGTAQIDFNDGLGNGTLDLKSGTLENTGNTDLTLNNPVTLEGTPSLNVGSAINLTGNVTANTPSTVTVTSTASQTTGLVLEANSTLAGAAVTFAGNESLVRVDGTLSAAVTVSSESELYLNAEGAGPVTVLGKLEALFNNSQFTGTITLQGGMIDVTTNGTGTGVLNLQSGTLKNPFSVLVSLNNSTINVQGNITIDAGGGLNLSAIGMVLLPGSKGTLIHTVNDPIQVEGTLEIANNGTLVVNDSVTVEGTGNLTVDSGGSLQVMNGGTLQESNNGVVTVQGTLDVPKGGTFDVGDRSTFEVSGSGSATIEGTLNIATGATLMNNGSLSFAPTATVTTGSGFAFDFPISGPTAGTDYFPLVVNAPLNLTGDTLTVNVSFSATPGQTFTLIQGNSGLTGQFTGLPEGHHFQLDGQLFGITYQGGSGHDVVLTRLAPVATVSGIVFNDFNVNGMRDSGEPGLANQTVYLDLKNDGTLDSGDPSVTTDSNGNYSFSNLAPGTYTIRQVLLGGVLLSSPASESISVTVAAGDDLTGQNFGDVPTSITVPLTLPPTTSFQPQGSANADFVEAVFRAVLNREPDSGGLAFWSGQLNNNTMTRVQVVDGIRNSPEHFGQEIDAFYLTLLGRPSDPGGRAAWVSQLEVGVREEQIAFDFLNSPEYLSKGDKFFVDAMYQSLLGRAFDPGGEQFWLNQLGNDSLGNPDPNLTAVVTHAQVINSFLFSQESLARLTEGYYQVFLQRQADTGGLNSWVLQLQQGLPFLTIGEEFIASDEFFNRAAANN